MTVKRGEVWLANLNPTRGSEQAGTRPVVIFQNDLINPIYNNIVDHSINNKLTASGTAIVCQNREGRRRDQE